MDLMGKTALVTGGAHRVGRSIAMGLAREGCNIGLHYHSADQEALQTLRDLKEEGIQAHGIQADLRRSKDLQKLFQTIDTTFDRLDILINSAAIMEKVAFAEVEYDAWYRTMALNLRAPFFCIQGAAKRMRPEGGVVINISDIAGIRPWEAYPVHSISKAGVEMLTQVAAKALAPTIRVNAIAPGPVMKPEHMDDTRWDEIGAKAPLRRPGVADDVARAVIFLCEHDYITGETLAVDGGYQLI